MCTRASHFDRHPLQTVKKRDASAAPEERDALVKIAELFEREIFRRLARRGSGHYRESLIEFSIRHKSIL